MKGVLVVVGLLTAFSLTVSAVKGQPFNNETNTTETVSQSATFTDCYSSFYSGMILWKRLGETNITATEPELKQFFTHICNFAHDETGKWMDLWKADELKMLYSQVDLDKFKTKYYPQGIPQSVINDFSVMVGMAGAGGNGTDTTTEDTTTTEDE